MVPNDIERFDTVTISEQSGVADAESFRQNEMHRYALPGAYPFSTCQISGRQIAVFIEMDTPAEVQVELASRKPDWLDEVVFAKAMSDPRADVAEIEAHVRNLHDAELQMCAFATACVAFNLGMFEVIPKRYVVSFGGRGVVTVSMHFNPDTESWSGEVTNEPSP